MSNIVDTLYKVVRKVIVPKYPWINDFVWTYHSSGGRKYYSLEVTVDYDLYMYRADTREMYDKLYKDTKMLFKLIGPDDDKIFDDVVIVTKD